MTAFSKKLVCCLLPITDSEITYVEQTIRHTSFFLSLSLWCGKAGGEIFHGSVKVITLLPKDHNIQLLVLTVTEPLGKPQHMRHLAKYSPLAICALQEVTASFSLPAHDTKLQAHLQMKENTTEGNRKQTTVS